jgi:DNA invertase Pin-like site-specific DNA recombinase
MEPSDLRPAIYNRVSKEEQARDSEALRRMIFHCDRHVERLGFLASEVPHFEDRQSGRDDDRTDFMRLCQEIRAGKINLLVVYRVDRITRRLVTNAELAEFFRENGIVVDSASSDRRFNLSHRSDWEDFVSQGVRAEGESLELSARCRKGLEFKASLGHFVGHIPTGYQRVNGILVPDERMGPKPEAGLNWFQTCVEAGKILVSAQSFIEAPIRIFNELGWKTGRTSLKRWSSSLAVQGHTVSKYAEFYNTHPAILTLDQANIIASQVYSRRQSWGSNKIRHPHLFSKLCVCAECGGPVFPKPTPSRAGAINTYTYYWCSAAKYRDPTSACPSILRGTPHGQRSIEERVIESAVIDKLVANAEKLIAASTTEIDNLNRPKVDPQRAKLERQLKQVRGMIDEFGDADGYLRSQVRSIGEQMEKLKYSVPTINFQARAEHIALFVGGSGDQRLIRGGDFIKSLPPWDRRAFYAGCIRRIVIRRNEVVEIHLKDFIEAGQEIHPWISP